jgi:hypothetical protein
MIEQRLIGREFLIISHATSKKSERESEKCSVPIRNVRQRHLPDEKATHEQMET